MLIFSVNFSSIKSVYVKMPKYLITEKVLIAVFSYRSYVETKLVFSFGIKVVRFKEFLYHVCWDKKKLGVSWFYKFSVVVSESCK